MAVHGRLLRVDDARWLPATTSRAGRESQRDAIVQLGSNTGQLDCLWSCGVPSDLVVRACPC